MFSPWCFATLFVSRRLGSSRTEQARSALPALMALYNTREAKARLSQILRGLDRGEGVIIKRRGHSCGRLTARDAIADYKLCLATLRGALSQLPDAGYQDFKAIWDNVERLPDLASEDIDG